MTQFACAVSMAFAKMDCKGMLVASVLKVGLARDAKPLYVLMAVVMDFALNQPFAHA